MGAESVGVAVEVEHDGTVQEAVEEGCGDGGVAQDLTPGADAFVAGEDDGGLQVPLRHHLEQGRYGFGGQRQVTELVDDQAGGAGEEAHGGGPAAFDRGAVAAGGEVGGGGEVGAVPSLGRTAGQANGEVGLADAWWVR